MSQSVTSLHSQPNTDYHQTTQRNTSSQQLQPLFIKNPQYNYGTATSSSQGSYDSGETTPHASMESLPPPPPYLIINEHGNPQGLPCSAEELSKRLSVAETVKTLTEKNHQPLSPNMVRRANSMKSSAEEAKEAPRPQANGRRGSTSTLESSKQRANLMQVLNQKLAQGQQQSPYGSSHAFSPPPQQQAPSQPTYHHSKNVAYQPQPQPIYSQVYQSQPIYQQVTPPHVGNGGPSNGSNGQQRQPRRFSEELLKTTATFVQNRVLGNKTPPPVVTKKEMFVQTLNAKLSQMRPSSKPQNSHDKKSMIPQQQMQQHGHHNIQYSNGRASTFGSKMSSSRGNGNGEVSRASRVRQWISSKTVSDPAVCRDSLMDQIRHGTQLKATRSMNDRSAPRIH